MITSITYDQLYGRQINLVGESAQQMLRNSSVLVVGLGGLGHPTVQYLASAGIGTLTLVDFDHVTASNLQRQVLFSSADIGQKKVDVVARRLRNLAPYCQVNTKNFLLNALNAETLFADHDVIIDCTDNFKTKFFLNDFAFKYKKILITASVYQREGQIFVFDFRSPDQACLRCVWSREPLDGCTKVCAEAGVWGPLLGVMGAQQAMLCLKKITENEVKAINQSSLYDAYSDEMLKLSFQRKKNCTCCVKENFSYGDRLQRPLDSFENSVVIVDIRSFDEVKKCPLPSSFARFFKIIHQPINKLDLSLLKEKDTYVFVCQKGIRSLKAATEYQGKVLQIFSLAGGIDSYLLNSENL